MTEEQKARDGVILSLDTYFKTTYKLHIFQYIKNVYGRKLNDYNVRQFFRELDASKTIDNKVKKDVVEKLMPYLVETTSKDYIEFHFNPARIEFYEAFIAQDKIEKIIFDNVPIDQIDVDLFLNPKCLVSFDGRNCVKVIEKKRDLVDNERFLKLKLSSDIQKNILLALLSLNEMARFEKLLALWNIDFTYNVKDLQYITFNEHIIKYFFEKKAIKLVYVKSALNLSNENFLIFYQYVKFNNIEEENILKHLRGPQYTKLCKQFTLYAG